MSSSPNGSPWRAGNLSGVAITATVRADGGLAPVGGVLEKLITAARDRALPRVHTVVVAAGQSEKDQDSLRGTLTRIGLQPDPRGGAAWRDPHDDFVVLPAVTVADAVAQLRADRGRWPRIDCALPARDPRFVGRERLFAFLDTFTARPEPGYLVLVGGVGTGKSTLLAERLHRATAAGHDPAFHVVSDRATSRDPDVIAGCLADRLRRKHRLVAPADWRDRVVPGTERLTWALAQLHQRGQREVLYLDAADQAHAGRDDRLLPGALDVLPPGVACVITTRPNLAFLGTRAGVTLRRLDEFVDDRLDIGAYLRPYVADSTLPADLVASIVGDPLQPPVFQTVRMRLRELEDPNTSPARRHQLLTTPGLWTQPSEEAIAEEILRRQGEARRAGLTDEAWWATLATVLAMREEAILPDTLRALGAWQSGVTDRVLTFAGSFFKPRPEPAPATHPYQWDHPGFRRALEPHLTPTQLVAAHQVFATGSAEWRALVGPPRAYALRHRLAHLREARDWDGLADALLDISYFEAALGAASIDQCLPEGHAAVAALPRDHALRPAAAAVARVLQADAHRLREDPTLLMQQLYNALVWDWPDTTPLGQRLRAATARVTRPWLRLTHPIPPTLARDSALRMTLTGHTEGVSAVAVAPDGATIISGSDDQTVRVWDARTGQLRATLTGHTGLVTAVAVATDGNTIISASRDQTVRVWDARTGQLRATLTGGTGLVTALAVAPDGATIISGSADHTVRVWDARTLQPPATLRGHSGQVSGVAVARDGATIISGSWDGAVRVWDARSGQPRAVFEGQHHWVHMSGPGASFMGHIDHVNAVAVAPDGATIIVGNNDGTVRVLDARSGQPLAVLKGHHDPVDAVAVTPDGNTIISASRDTTVRVWDARTGQPRDTLTEHTGWVTAVAVAPDGATIISGSSDQTVRVWDVRTGQPRVPLTGHTEDVTAVAVAPDGATIITGGRDRTVRIWDARTGQLRTTLTGHTDVVTAVAVAPDGGTIVSGSDDRIVRVWDAGTWQPRITLIGHVGSVDAVTVAPDGTTIVTGSRVPLLQIWDTRTGTGQWRPPIKAHSALVTAVIVTPDGETIVSGSNDRTVRVWDTRTGQRRATLSGHTGGVKAVAVASDGATIISGSSDHSVRIWDARTGQLRTTFTGHTQGVTAVAVTPDGTIIFSGSKDRTLRVWDARRPALRATWEAPGVIATLHVNAAAAVRVTLGLHNNRSAACVTLEFVEPDFEDPV